MSMEKKKSFNFFLNLEKKSFRSKSNSKIDNRGKKLTKWNEINNNIFTFYKNLSSKQTDFKQNDLIN